MFQEVYGVELDPLTSTAGTNMETVENPSEDTSPSSNCCLRLLNWILGVENDVEDAAKNHKAIIMIIMIVIMILKMIIIIKIVIIMNPKAMAEHLAQLSTLQQSSMQKVLLFTDHVIVVIITIIIVIIVIIIV